MRSYATYAVSIASAADELLKDREWHNGKRGIFPYLLPDRAVYLIETGDGDYDDVCRLALDLARADGIPRPLVKGMALEKST